MAQIKQLHNTGRIPDWWLQELVDLINSTSASAESNAENIENNAEEINARIDEMFKDIVGLAPETLDSFEEIAAALKDNPGIIDSINEFVSVTKDDLLSQITANDAESDAAIADLQENKLDKTQLASYNEYGIVKIKKDNGIEVTSDGLKVATSDDLGTTRTGGKIAVCPATTQDIDGRTQSYKPITPNTLQYAVKSILKESMHYGDIRLIDGLDGEATLVVKRQSDGGIGSSNGEIYIVSAKTSDIDERSSSTKPIVPSTLDYAVTSVVNNLVKDIAENDLSAEWDGINEDKTLAGLVNTLNDSLKAYVDSNIGANDAMVFKGTVSREADLPVTYETGWTYRVATPGTYAGQKCEIGDMIICKADGGIIYESETLSLVDSCYKNDTSAVVEFEYDGTDIVDVIFTTPAGGYFPYIAKTSLGSINPDATDIMPDFAYQFSGTNQTELTEKVLGNYILDKDGKLCTAPNEQTVTLTGVQYNNDHGLLTSHGATFTFRTQAPFKLTVGTCTYGDGTGQLTIKNGSDDDWAIIQNNVDGAVVLESGNSATANNLVIFGDNAGTVTDSGESVSSIVAKIDAVKIYSDDQVATVDTKVNTLEGTVTTLETAVTGIGTSITDGDATTLASAKAYTDEQVATVNTTVTALEGTAANIKTTADDAATKATAVEDLVGTLSAKVTELDTSVGNNKTAADETASKVTALETTITGIDTSITDGDDATLASAKSYVDEQIGTVNTAVTTLEGTVTSNKTDADETAAKVTTLETTVTSIGASITDGDATTLSSAKAYTDEQIGTVNSAVTTLEGTVTSNKTAADETAAKVTTLETTVSTLSTSITDGDATTLASAKAYTDEQVATVNTTVTTLEGTVTSNKTDADTAINDLTTRVATIEGAEYVLKSEYDAKVTELVGLIEALTSRVDALNTETA